ncbi:hypothetical protein GALL_529920 [mine drainage metagenome]|uniref:Uncharacterized protein n=1 Tax=mine drainage metagenome TaxID=410659 RepID=A0A1J5P305_9ZZZZ
MRLPGPLQGGLEQFLGQQAHVFGKKAEQALGQKVGNIVGIYVALAQAIGQGGEAFGGGFGDVAAGLLRAKALGIGPQAAQQRLFGGLVQLGQQHRVHL